MSGRGATGTPEMSHEFLGNGKTRPRFPEAGSLVDELVLNLPAFEFTGKSIQRAAFTAIFFEAASDNLGSATRKTPLLTVASI